MWSCVFLIRARKRTNKRARVEQNDMTHAHMSTDDKQVTNAQASLFSLCRWDSMYFSKDSSFVWLRAGRTDCLLCICSIHTQNYRLTDFNGWWVHTQERVWGNSMYTTWVEADILSKPNFTTGRVMFLIFEKNKSPSSCEAERQSYYIHVYVPFLVHHCDVFHNEVSQRTTCM